MTQPSDQSYTAPLSGPCMLEMREAQPIPGSAAPHRLRCCTPVLPGEQVVVVVGLDGKGRVAVIPPIMQGEHVRGCAICEQLHPELGYEGCPLDEGEVVDRAIGPVYVDGEPTYFMVKELR